MSIVFVYTQLKSKTDNSVLRMYSFNVKTVIFQTIQFCLSTQLSSIWLIDRTLSGTTTPEGTWERWQWRGIPHSPKFQHYWDLTITLFSVKTRTLVGVGSNSSVEMHLVYSTDPANWVTAELDLLHKYWLLSIQGWPQILPAFGQDSLAFIKDARLKVDHLVSGDLPA